MKVIGLTGGIASGKSTISDILKEMNIPVIDADKIARDVVSLGSPILDYIAREFGKEILMKDGSLDRKALGAIVFKDQRLLHRLNSMIHPEIKKKIVYLIEKYRAENQRCCVVDAALLIEAKYMDIVDVVILVYTDEATQLKRLMKRDNLCETEAIQRMKSQLSFDEKRKYANFVIDNSRDIEFTRFQLSNVINEALNLEENNV